MLNVKLSTSSDMGRVRRFSSASALSALLGLGLMTGLGCAEASDETTEQAADAESATERARLVACHLDDGTVEMTAHVHACDPQDKKKTTICHVPPGNPANAHTLCIGNPAVGPHLANHPDYLGPCKVEMACPPAHMPAADAGGAGGCSAGGTGGSVSNTGGSGAGGSGGSGSASGGATGGAPPPITID